MQAQKATADKKQWVNALKAGQSVDAPFLIAKKELTNFSQPSRNGATQFLRLQLADATGTIQAVVWENGPAVYDGFKSGDIVRVFGDVTDYKGLLQITVRKIEAPDLALIDRGWFQCTSSRSLDEMRNELHSICASVSDPHLSGLLSTFFDDPVFWTRFSTAPAARSIHHAYVGGLLEHTLEVAALCRRALTLGCSIPAHCSTTSASSKNMMPKACRLT